MSSSLCATLLMAALGGQLGVYYGDGGFGFSGPAASGYGTYYGPQGYGTHYGTHSYGRPGYGYGMSGYGYGDRFDGSRFGYVAPTPGYSTTWGYSTPTVVYGTQVTGYGTPISGYGTPVSSVDPCPFAQSSAGGYAASPPPDGERREAGYGPRGERPKSAPAAIVHMTDKARFEPAEITINVGDTVEWRSDSQHAHTVTFDPELAKDAARVALPEGAESFDSGEIPSGERFTHTFKVPGVYRYVCLPHEDKGMVGTIIVKPGPGRGQDPADAAEEPVVPPPEARGGDY